MRCCCHNYESEEYRWNFVLEKRYFRKIISVEEVAIWMKIKKFSWKHFFLSIGGCLRFNSFYQADLKLQTSSSQNFSPLYFKNVLTKWIESCKVHATHLLARNELSRIKTSSYYDFYIFTFLLKIQFLEFS